MIKKWKNMSSLTDYNLFNNINIKPNIQATLTNMRSAAGRNSTWCVTKIIVFSLRIPRRHSCRKHTKQKTLKQYFFLNKS